jgi:hypothetical protein
MPNCICLALRSKIGLLAVSILFSACTGGSTISTPTTPTTTPTTTPSSVNLEAAILAATPALSKLPMDTIVTQKIVPQIEVLFNALLKDGLNTTLNGVRVFDDSGDKFLPGKIAIGTSYLLLNTAPNDPKFLQYLNGYRQNIDMVVDIKNETWGQYYFLSALWKLKKAGLLDQAVSAASLVKLQSTLDWRSFVRTTDYSLINLPTNYYGVAFSIARLRYLMGWESAQASEVLLQKMMSHYKTFSAYGFSDETDGSGRFDRYSVLLIGEIGQRLIETDMQISVSDTALLKAWLRQSVDLIKLRLNHAGNGIEYGRSLAAYADTAFAEVLSAAAHMNVLNTEEKDIAYAFATRIAAKYVQFWIDEQTGSVNMWEQGRRTDSYRGISRILGENFSLAHQLIYTNNLWKADAYADKAPISTDSFTAYLNKLPRSTLTWFAKNVAWSGASYDRALLTYRDGLRIIGLPMVNGDATYHRNNQYFSIPYSYNMLSGVADMQWPQLQPQFTMSNKQVLIPAVYINNIQTQESIDGKVLTLTYELDAMDNTSGSSPVKDASLSASTRYVFEPGQITRIDSYKPAGGNQSMSKIELEFASFSDGITASGNRFSYANGDVTEFSLESGQVACVFSDVRTSANYQTPTGPLKTTVKCSWPAMTLSTAFEIKWVLKYKSPNVAGFAPR